jgi:hypothetical protein
MLHTNPTLASITPTFSFPAYSSGSTVHSYASTKPDIVRPLHAATVSKNVLLSPNNEMDPVPISFLPRTDKGESTTALARLRTFATWRDNWDGEGASAPDGKALDAASLILGLLSSDLGKVPKVMLNGDGEPMFVLIDKHFEIAVTVKSKTEISFYVAHGNDEDGGLVDFNGRQLPTLLRAAIRGFRSL